MYLARTRREFLRYFRAEILPGVRAHFEQDGRVDIPARREEWNNHIDALVQDRQLPRHAVNWSCPW